MTYDCNVHGIHVQSERLSGQEISARSALSMLIHTGASSLKRLIEALLYGSFLCAHSQERSMEGSARSVAINKGEESWEVCALN